MEIKSSVSHAQVLEVDNRFDKDMEMVICAKDAMCATEVVVYLDVKRAKALRDHLTHLLPIGRDARAQFEQWCADDPFCQQFDISPQAKECLFRAWSVK